MPIKPYALPDRAVRAIETLERAVNTASGPTVTASCDDITALIDSIDDLLNRDKNAAMTQIICDMASENLIRIIRDASSELNLRMCAVKRTMDLEPQP